jgi:hypothetical protein
MRQPQMGGILSWTPRPKAETQPEANADFLFDIASGGIGELTVKLVELAKQSGKDTQMQSAIKANRIAHENNPAKHKEWLERQLARADEWAGTPA